MVSYMDMYISFIVATSYWMKKKNEGMNEKSREKEC